MIPSNVRVVILFLDLSWNGIISHIIYCILCTGRSFIRGKCFSVGVFPHEKSYTWLCYYVIISFQVQNINKKNYRATVTECRSLVTTFGTELERHLYRCLLSQLPARANAPISPSNNKKDSNFTHCLSFIQEETDQKAGSDRYTSLLIW